MNEHLAERFRRSRGLQRGGGEVAEVLLLPPALNPLVRGYFDDAIRAVDGGDWLQRPDVPTASEVLAIEKMRSASTTSSGDLEIAPNKVIGAYDSKEQYLQTQYELLRRNALKPLYEAVSSVRMMPEAVESSLLISSVGIYEKVHICGITCSPRGLATRVTFSIRRAGKQIRWEQSKRLISGSLVALSPASDKFQKKIVIATVAARPLDMLAQNPPEIDLFIARAEEQEFDPSIEWVMVENRQGFYEADRHTMTALQKMMKEPFPLSRYLVSAQAEVRTPAYVKALPNLDLSTVLHGKAPDDYSNVNIIKNWPAQPGSDLDTSQLDSLHRILAKELAIIQGPPGCGKTHVSKEALKLMLANRKPGDPPIIIACQTNHAVDQLLGKVLEFDDNFIRLGGRSKDKGAIRERTLYEIKQRTSGPPLAGCSMPKARIKMKSIQNDIGLLLAPLQPENSAVPLDHRMLENLKLLTKKQADTLEAGASQWVQAKQDGQACRDARASPFFVWLGRDLVSVPLKQQPEQFGFDFEEEELGYEQLKELEAENMAKDDDDFETLAGLWLPLADKFTGRKIVGSGITKAKIKSALEQQDMWKIPQPMRAPIYSYLQAELKAILLVGFREKVKEFNSQAINRRIGQWEEEEVILKKANIIGMTTTGFSKYRPLIAALQPKTVLIEEAAETLEAPVAVACLPSVQQLILVGDHQQLRPHCQVKEHEDAPYYLNVSLFERLVANQVEFSRLAKQRRMIPEIRRILYPIYRNEIEDHDFVLDKANRPDVKGMGGINSFFFTHKWQERRDDQSSSYNPEEAEMIVGFVDYLLQNGTPTPDITVLTFYNGQRKKLLELLRRSETLAKVDGVPKVVTVDSYQGEENKVVILSLVRSNQEKKVGFLSIDNRVCVALSRAQCGFYVFGNGELLWDFEELEQRRFGKAAKQTWTTVLKIFAGQHKKTEHLKPTAEPRGRMLDALPLRCANHNNLVEIKSPDDWETNLGGCNQPCGGHLRCGHLCPHPCHPFPHDWFYCDKCAPAAAPKASPDPSTSIRRASSQNHERGSSQSTTTTNSWQSFSSEEPQRYAKAAAAIDAEIAASKRASPQKASKAKKTVWAAAGKVAVKTQSLLHVDAGIEEVALTISHNEYTEKHGGMNEVKGKGKGKNKKSSAGEHMAEEKLVAKIANWSSEPSLLD